MNNQKSKARGLLTALCFATAFASAAHAGPTYVYMNVKAANANGCDYLGMNSGLHFYKCKGTEMNTFSWLAGLYSDYYNTANGRKRCSFNVKTWGSGGLGIYPSTWHHEVKVVEGGYPECSVDIENENTWYAIVNLKNA